MVLAKKSEVEEIRRVIPHSHITRTRVQKSKRHHYYVEEDRAVLGVLAKIRGCEVTNLIQ